MVIDWEISVYKYYNKECADTILTTAAVSGASPKPDFVENWHVCK